RTYAAVSGDWLRSRVDRLVGAFDILPPQSGGPPPPPFIFQSGTGERLDFEERTLAVTVNQLVGQEWAFGARYRLSEAELDDRFTDIPASADLSDGFRRHRHVEATLHQANPFAI